MEVRPPIDPGTESLVNMCSRAVEMCRGWLDEEEAIEEE